MRLAVCTLSAVLLSGCSWLGGAGNVFNGGGQGHNANSSQYQYGAGQAARGQHQYRAQGNPCQVYSPQAPIPQGCHPSQVTLGTAGGFPQQPNFGGGQYTSQGYGSHAGVAHQQAASYNPRKNKLRKPRFRGSLSLGVEKSVSGSLLSFSDVGDLDPAAGYNPQNFNQVFVNGTPADGQVTTTTYTANSQTRDEFGAPAGATQADIFAPNSFDALNAPDISFDDVYSTPARIAGGAEYILSPKTTLFANAGYSYAEGKSTSTAASIIATPYEFTSVQNFDAAGVADGAPIETIVAGNSTQIANFGYDFTDMKRIDLEAGARRYFDPIVKSQGYKTLTPFVGASVGASRYNSVSYDVVQTQSAYIDSFPASTGDGTFEISGPATRVDLYDSQWVASGQLNAGMEWQVTPKTAFAFETGVRIEGARDYSNGVKGDTNVAIPVTIRGSYNF
ncbi:hypothetical protein N9W89_02010 [Hellea sp.]|nr:hypothetical protein [Hellea sp.]